MAKEPAKTFKVGFIGAGAIARTHMDNLQKVGGVEIVCASDVSQATLDIARQKYGIARIYTDYQEMLNKETELDAVDICTPNALHAPTTIASFEAGKHVMVEKPMAMTVSGAQAMLEASRRANKQLVIGFQFRFDPRTKLIRDQISSGSFGKVLYVRAQWLRRRGIPNWGVFGRKELQGGGPMIDIGVHVIETAHYLMGSPKPVTVTGNTWTYFGNKPSAVACPWPNWDAKTYNVEDLAVGMVRFETGAMLTVETSFVSHIEKDIWNIHVFGENGGAEWNDCKIFTDHGGYMMNMTPAFIPKTDYWEYKMKHFVEVCRDGRENESSGEHGLMIQKILDGVYGSTESGKEVAIA
ncbi:MAG TPA: Gfo/Idh/MocA family oxidoreductase [Tepidisphaeraceae bacterium]|nr:Gfo/Idh/MocA family oxidoreductase [Tepidisphaeraceae bacterium]